MPSTSFTCFSAFFFWKRVSQFHYYGCLGLDNSVCKEADQCPVGCLAEFLVTRCQKHPLPKTDNLKSFQTLPSVPWATKPLWQRTIFLKFFFKLQRLWKDGDQMLQELVPIHVVMMFKCETKGSISHRLYKSHKRSTSAAFNVWAQYYSVKLHCEIIQCQSEFEDRKDDIYLSPLSNIVCNGKFQAFRSVRRLPKAHKISSVQCRLGPVYFQRQ